jgi:hypothetical protein
MQASRRWRDWTPNETTQVAPECELTKLPKPISVSFVSSDPRGFQKNVTSDGIPPHDPAEWREPFVRWLDSACLYHSRCFGGVGCMHVAFCEWAHANDDVGCNRNTFEGMLEELGFLIVDGLVSGVTFGEDLDAVSNLLPSEPRSNRFDRGNASNTIGKE